MDQMKFTPYDEMKADQQNINMTIMEFYKFT